MPSALKPGKSAAKLNGNACIALRKKKVHVRCGDLLLMLLSDIAKRWLYLQLPMVARTMYNTDVLDK